VRAGCGGNGREVVEVRGAFVIELRGELGVE
jgi:hypothetical protein